MDRAARNEQPLGGAPTQNCYAVADHPHKETLLTIVIMMLAGLVAGFVLDNLIARMAREPYQRVDQEDGEPRERGPGATLDLSRATPCGLIVTELITNSFKYAFPPSFDCMKIRSEPCTIRVSLEHDGEDYCLSVSDNGIGLPRGFDIRTAQSLGLRLVYFLARHQLKARIELKTEGGTEITFRFS